jgi:hypothetical protein
MDTRPLLVHLESPFAEYTSGLVPAKAVVLAGLRWETDYWPSLAIDWLEQGCPVDDEVHDSMLAVAANLNFSQQTRHRAFTLCRRWERYKIARP